MADIAVVPIATCGVCGHEEFKIRFISHEAALICTACHSENELLPLAENRMPLLSRLSQGLIRFVTGLRSNRSVSEDESGPMFDDEELYGLLARAIDAIGQDCPEECATGVSEDASWGESETEQWTGHSADFFRLVMTND